MGWNKHWLRRSLFASSVFVGMSLPAISAGFLDTIEFSGGKVVETTQGEEVSSLAGSFLAALSATAHNDNADAIENYKKALDFDPGNLTMKQSLMLAYVANGQIPDAIELLKSMPVKEQEQKLDRLIVAADAIKQKSWARAVNSVDKIQGSDLDILISKSIGAWALFGEGKLDTAVARMGEVDGPEWVGMIRDYHSGLLLSASGKDKEAIPFFQKAISQRAIAGAFTETYMRALEGLARSQGKIGELENAAKTVAEGLDILPNHPPLVRFQTALNGTQKSAPLIASAQEGAGEIFFNVGAAISRQSEVRFAQEHLQMAIYLAPGNETALMSLGNAYTSQEKFAEAAKYYGEIKPASAFYRRAQLEIGLNLNRMEQYPASEEVLVKLFDADPDDVVTALSLGGVYGQRLEYEKAVKLYDKVISRLSPVKERDWIIFYRRGIANERTKNWPEAEADFKKALELSPKQADVLNYLGYSWIDQGINLDEGLKMIKDAVELKPNSGFIIDSLGWAYYRLGKYEDAVTQLQQALELMPSDPVVNDHLGDAYWQTGRKLEAVFQWKHALSHKPEEKELEKINQKIQSGLTN